MNTNRSSGARDRAAAHLLRSGVRARSLAARWQGEAASHAQSYLNLTVEALQGRSRPTEWPSAFAGLWLDGAHLAVTAWHDVIQACFELHGPGGEGLVYFEIDPLAEVADPLPLGGIASAELPDLVVTALARTGGGRPIPAASVELTTGSGEVLVGLRGLAALGLQVGELFTGAVKRRSGAVVSSVVVHVGPPPR
ncbi:MAG: hypothetical protein FJ104_03835 [Deltaproteobacteria bacterium]|nr:hypothetical protein [Deltaproteobacteria bacterium]